jgi:hypothetical protein
MDWGIILGVVGAIGVPLALIAIGISLAVGAAPSRGEIIAARICFIAAVLIMGAGVFLAVWNYPEGSRIMRIVMTALVGALLFGGLTASLDWLKSKQQPGNTEGTTPLAKLSDEELRDRAIEFAARIRKFEISAQTDAYSLMQAGGPPPPANYQDAKAREEWQKAVSENRQAQTARGVKRLGEISTVFRNEYSYNAGVLESDIKGRLERKGKFGPYGKDSERRVLDGSFTGPTPISNFADYLAVR